MSDIDRLVAGAGFESLGGLKPTRLYSGTYRFVRHAFESEVTIYEPSGDSYVLEYFDFEIFLKRILRLSEMDAISLTDRIWNFRNIEYHTSTGQIQRFDLSFLESEVIL